jgi:hypothetical protein
MNLFILSRQPIIRPVLLQQQQQQQQQQQYQQGTMFT